MRARQALLWLTLSAAALPTAARTLYVSPSPGDIVPAGPVYRTISAALDTVRPGDVLVINRGVYRESIELVADDGRPRSGLTIQGEDRGSVVVKGSDVVLDWEKVGDGIYVRRNWPSEPQQVFVNGDSLQQLGGTVFGGYPEDRRGKLFKQYAERLWPGRLAGRDAQAGRSSLRPTCELDAEPDRPAVAGAVLLLPAGRAALLGGRAVCGAKSGARETGPSRLGLAVVTAFPVLLARMAGFCSSANRLRM